MSTMRIRKPQRTDSISAAPDPRMDEKERLVNSKANDIATAAQLKAQSEQLKLKLDLVIRRHSSIMAKLDKKPGWFSDDFFYFELLQTIRDDSSNLVLALEQIELVVNAKGYRPPEDIKSLLQKLDLVYKDLKIIPKKLMNLFDKAIAIHTAGVNSCLYCLSHPNNLIASDQRDQMIISDATLINFFIPHFTAEYNKHWQLLNAIKGFKENVYKLFGIIEQPDPAKDPLLIFKRSRAVPMNIKQHDAKQDKKDEKYRPDELSIFKTSKPVPMSLDALCNKNNGLGAARAKSMAYKR